MAIDFDGDNDVVNVSDSTPLKVNASGMSWMAWINSDSISDTAGILRKFNTDYVLATVGSLVWGEMDGASINTGSTMSDATWHHLACTFNGTTLRTYLDGVEQDTGTPSGISDDAGIVTIGASDSQPFNGRIDDARVYNRGLSAAEVQTIFASGGVDGIVDGLVGRWRMNEKPPGTTASGAGTARDVSPFGHDGDPTNSPIYAAGQLRFRRKVS